LVAVFVIDRAGFSYADKSLPDASLLRLDFVIYQPTLFTRKLISTSTGSNAQLQ